jgi:hypothetical protein
VVDENVELASAVQYFLRALRALVTIIVAAATTAAPPPLPLL